MLRWRRNGNITFDTTLIALAFCNCYRFNCTFFGQRIAKITRAATLVGYFMLSILGIITFGLNEI